MTAGLCLDSGEFIPAEELNQMIDMTNKLPPHPEHTMQWSPREQRVLVSHFDKSIEPLQHRIAELETDAQGWLRANSPNGWIDNMRVRIAELEAKLIEQARIVGMGAERELALLSTVETATRRIAELESAIKKLHKAKGRHNSQNAACDLYDLLGLHTVRTDQNPAQLASGQK